MSASTGTPTRQPTCDTGIYLRTHKHKWTEVGAKRFESGTWHPVFSCWCEAVIVDLHVEVSGVAR